MGGSLPWEKSIMEMSAVEIFINNERERAANHWNEDMEDDGENEEGMEEFQMEEFQVVYEHCDYIRFMYTNGGLNYSKTTDGLLRLLDTLTDFCSDFSGFLEKAKYFEADYPNSFPMYNRILTLNSQTGELAEEEEEEEEQSRNYNAKLIDKTQRAKKLIDEFNHKILPRFMQIYSMCNYHIRSIKRLVKLTSEGEIEPGTISSPTWNFYSEAISILHTRIKTIRLSMRSL